jgi:hypothetical protein
MLKLGGLLMKFTFFSILVLVLGNALHWRGRTISDQVRIHMAHAERTELYETVKAWAERITLDAKKGATKRANQMTIEEIPATERQKLNALIRELNH